MANRLAGETSPYLRQHQENPVDWYPWGDELLEQASQLTESLGRAALLEAPAGAPLPGREVLDGAYQQLRARFDPQWGGFGPAPKFPQTDSIELLLRAYVHNRSDDTLAMA